VNKSAKVYVAGHQGMVGSAIARILRQTGYNNLVTRSRSELDLTQQQEVNRFFESEKPEQVYLAAAKVGGIYANNAYPAEFIYQNLMVQVNVIEAAYRNGVKKLLFLGSSCIYPRLASQPMKESSLLTGPLEPTNEPYAIAKIAGIKLCESYNRQYGVDYRSVMPTNLYGPGDNYHPENSHVIPALIRRFHEAKANNSSKVVVWGTGNAKREFLFVEDMAEASIYVMNLDFEDYRNAVLPMQSHINVGFGTDITIRQLAETIASVVGFEGKIEFDSTKPDGAPRKFLDCSLLNRLGWYPKVQLEAGLKIAYANFVDSNG